MLTFAVGCILGRSAQLTALLERCHDYAGRQPARYVFLGNFINAGPDSRGVVETIINLLENTANRVIALAGENEELLRRWQMADNMPRWLVRGGSATLRSYGATSPRGLSAKHQTWLQGLPNVFSDQHRLFVPDENQLWPREHRLIVVGSRAGKGPIGHTLDGGKLYLGLRASPPRTAGSRRLRLG